MSPKISNSPSTTQGFTCFWEYASKRQQIYWQQLNNEISPPINDNVLAIYRFTNVYRASDRVSQYLINQVQCCQIWNWQDTFTRTLIFKFFNRLDTWQHLIDQLGELNTKDLLGYRVDQALEMIAGQRPIYNPAYIMPPPDWLDGPKFKRHLELIRHLIKEKVHCRIQASPSMESAFKILRNYRSIGDFLAYQLIIDLNYSSHLKFEEDEFVIAGPGARRGLRKCFSETNGLTDSQLIRWTAKRQDKEFSQRNLPWTNLFGRRLQLIDIQNIFCEVDKYTRLTQPELSKLVPGKRPKQFYRPLGKPMSAKFPKKWGLPLDV